MKSTIKGSLQVFFGSLISAVGIQMFLFANLGVDPISTLLLGILNHTNLRFGTASQLFNVIILILVFLLDRKKIGIGSVINGLSVGFFINLLSQFKIDHYFIGNAFLYGVLGPIILGIGTGIYLQANLGCGALEGLMMIFSEKFNISVKYIRMFLDLLLVVSGILLGSIYGIGTLLGVILIGPSIEYSLKFINQLSSKKKKRE
ncbi:putative membrane protein YczE [Enterococcus sp. PF1-24]|uniref:YczE/YyaS/YitT family protein n=1 Tax=unclassified Enterococcus TaxID=2608891 RepID=UPI002475ECDD|nr:MULTISPECIES: YitT family protein [unclassified Enterococcus]MDH6363951.1 putative membrane protein YczE [Enterococcus sp. PFB1-1]MDH6401052.1 putative membrane protein YczE [Enterococcus sp. PF1-24]